MVTMARRWKEIAGARQVGIASPSTSTLHAPHCSSPQPNFAPKNPRSFRRMYSNGVLGSHRTVHVWPFTWSARSSSMAPLYGRAAGLSSRIALGGSSGMHHSPAFDIDEEALRTGTRVLVDGA